MRKLSQKTRCDIYKKIVQLLDKAAQNRNSRGFQHKDLHVENIFVHLSKNKKSRSHRVLSVGIIDFGHVEFDNLLLHPQNLSIPAKIAEQIMHFNRSYVDFIDKKSANNLRKQAKLKKTSDAANLFVLKEILCREKYDPIHK